MPWHNGGKTNLWLCCGVLLILALVCFEGANANGPLRRFFSRNRTPTASGYVCENGVCYPSGTVTSYTVASPVAVLPAPTQVSTTVSPTSAAALAEAVSLVEAEGGKFHRAVIQAAVKARQAGTINRGDLMRLRVAMLAPAFRERAEDLALIQVSSSGEDLPFTLTEAGTIDRTSIDWAGLAAFIEKLVPLILTLLKAFGI